MSCQCSSLVQTKPLVLQASTWAKPNNTLVCCSIALTTIPSVLYLKKCAYSKCIYLVCLWNIFIYSDVHPSIISKNYLGGNASFEITKLSGITKVYQVENQKHTTLEIEKVFNETEVNDVLRQELLFWTVSAKINEMKGVITL